MKWTDWVPVNLTTGLIALMEHPDPSYGVNFDDIGDIGFNAQWGV